PGTIGFWGAPTVRSVAAPPPPSEGKAGPETPQGVILIWADTLRRDHLGIYGYARPTSPVIDRLAREGILFRDCVGHASWTKVATPSLMTSLYPTSHGVRDFGDRLPASATTLAEVYRAGGYAAFDRNWYDGSIREMDTEIGRLVEGLGTLGLRGKVVVAFTGDHGEEFLEHGRMFHGQTVYGEMNNVPLVLWRPGALPAGRVIDQTVQIVDVMPTLLEMSGLRVPEAAQGTSLVSFWTAKPGVVRAATDARTAISE